MPLLRVCQAVVSGELENVAFIKTGEATLMIGDLNRFEAASRSGGISCAHSAAISIDVLALAPLRSLVCSSGLACPPRVQLHLWAHPALDDRIIDGPNHKLTERFRQYCRSDTHSRKMYNTLETVRSHIPASRKFFRNSASPASRSWRRARLALIFPGLSYQ